MPTFVIEPGFADRLTRRFGPHITDWVQAAPTLAERLAQRWRLTLNTMFPDGSTSLTVGCSTEFGADAVLKLCPQLDVITEQDRVLRAFQPGGRVPRVLRSAPEHGAMLLERLPGERATTPTAVQLAEVLSGLHGAVAFPSAVLDKELRDGVEHFLARAEAKLGLDGIVGVVFPGDIARARGL